jgi:hypothetical protein
MSEAETGFRGGWTTLAGRRSRRYAFNMRHVPYLLLVPVALFMAIAPLGEPSHLVEKLQMLAGGTLRRPIDVFDLLLHGTPLVLLVWKGVSDLTSRRSSRKPSR